MGHRISWHYDVDADGTVESTSDDPPFYFAYNESWQQVATYRDDDTDPKEQFVNHNAGLGGYGGSSAIDGVILRDKDDNSSWPSAADGTLEDRIYYCQNWRGDVSVIVTDAGKMVEWVKYTAYGIPFGMPLADTDSDGDLDSTDTSAIRNWSGGYDVRADPNLDGVIDGSDTTMAGSASPITLGFGALSNVGNRIGYAGYELAPELAYTMWFARNRAMISELLGRWITRDPIGYIAGANLYQYVNSNPLRFIDPLGLAPGDGGGGPEGYGERRYNYGVPVLPPGYGLWLTYCERGRSASDPVAPPGSGFAFTATSVGESGVGFGSGAVPGFLSTSGDYMSAGDKAAVEGRFPRDPRLIDMSWFGQDPLIVNSQMLNWLNTPIQPSPATISSGAGVSSSILGISSVQSAIAGGLFCQAGPPPGTPAPGPCVPNVGACLACFSNCWMANTGGPPRFTGIAGGCTLACTACFKCLQLGRLLRYAPWQLKAACGATCLACAGCAIGGAGLAGHCYFSCKSWLCL